ncbi:hypothetical protein [Halalkalibacter krulwichiae]|uniref:Uncharacterized protein n=1 Tax=Halalkalibacter krulwichiae TaxID=199441 RepID=A0A1X9MDU1_9BACI|nr:hypothetical protein [Halalkalibacter krulwichiae]ARK30794.1 hypothetical protein BkAM31D_13640 [Halalkalibacter krulwichiae]
MTESQTMKFNKKEGMKYRIDWQETEYLLEYEHEGYYRMIHNSILDKELYRLWEVEIRELEEAEAHWIEQQEQLHNDPEYQRMLAEQYTVWLESEEEYLRENPPKDITPVTPPKKSDGQKANAFKIQIASEVVRDKTINDKEFVLYVKLVQLYQRHGQREEYVIKEYEQLMHFLKFKDNRTFKKCWNSLHKRGLIRNEIKNLPKTHPLPVRINPEYIPRKKENPIKFTQLTHRLIDRYVLDKIGYTGVRIMYYLESYIDRTKFLWDHYAYPSEELIAEDTGNSRTTIIKYIKILDKVNLMKVQRNYLESNGIDVTDKGKEIETFIRWNNKYFVHDDKIAEKADKWKLESLGA